MSDYDDEFIEAQAIKSRGALQSGDLAEMVMSLLYAIQEGPGTRDENRKAVARACDRLHREHSESDDKRN